MIQEQLLVLTPRTSVQCDMLNPADKYSVRKHSLLIKRFANLHILILDVKGMPDLPSNIHLIPYATNYHYVPKRPSRLVALQDTHNEVSSVFPPSDGWLPENLLKHERPLFVSYIGANSRGEDYPGDTWHIKRLVRGSAVAQLKVCCSVHLTASVHAYLHACRYA
jgi:hypothetical protein